MENPDDPSGAQNAEHASADAAIARVGLANHGIGTFRKFRDEDVTARQIARRARRGTLIRLANGVFAIGHEPTTDVGQWMALVRRAGAGAQLTGLVAAELLQISRWRVGTPEILVSGRHVPIPGATLRVTRTLIPAELEVRNLLPITRTPRTIFELAVGGKDEYQLAWVMHQAGFRKRFVAADVRACAERNRKRPGPAYRTVRRALELNAHNSRGTRSAVEDAALAVARKVSARLGVEDPLVCTDGVFRDGPIELDQQWPRLRLCFEFDGSQHLLDANRKLDADRDARLAAQDWTTVRFPWWLVLNRPMETELRTERALRAAVFQAASHV